MFYVLSHKNVIKWMKIEIETILYPKKQNPFCWYVPMCGKNHSSITQRFYSSYRRLYAIRKRRLFLTI